MPGSYLYPASPSTTNAGIVDGGPLLTVRLWGEATFDVPAPPCSAGQASRHGKGVSARRRTDRDFVLEIGVWASPASISYPG